jgi:hypothetical protein
LVDFEKTSGGDLVRKDTAPDLSDQISKIQTWLIVLGTTNNPKASRVDF